MYEKLTTFIFKLRNGPHGEWTDANDVAYENAVYDLEKEMYSFIREHQNMGISNYKAVLEEANIRKGGYTPRTVEVSTLDGRTVLALIFYVFRTERFCDGTILNYLNDGYIEKWLLRLQEIDNQQRE